MTYSYYAVLVLAAAFVGRPAHADAAMPMSAALGLRALGLILVIVASLGRIWCSAFIAGHKDSRLVTEGPYSLCRHPLYALSFIGGLGLGIASGSLALTAITALVLAVLLAGAARTEERRLAELHGEAFRDYAAATPRWLPRETAAQRIPASLELQLRIFSKSFLDAGSFILLFLLIDTVRSLREAGSWPTMFTLP
jgi:protein-S-isoprenylcysteine O-methyltransferase Ste14